jgi:hypothetical protein
VGALDVVISKGSAMGHTRSEMGADASNLFFSRDVAFQLTLLLSQIDLRARAFADMSMIRASTT